MDIGDDKYDQLLLFIESGSQGNLSPELVKYVELIEVIRGMHMRYNNRQAIINFLQQPPYKLSYYLATQRYNECINFFYLDHEIKKDAWRNVYAEKLDRAADLVLKTATCAKDIDIYKNTLLSAMDARGLNRPDELEIPEEFFIKQIKIYTLDPKLLNRKRANQKVLAAHIDSLDVPEAVKQRAKSDAMIEDIEFLAEDDNQQN